MTQDNILLKTLIALLENEPKGKVLDFGCASGDYSLELHRRGFDVTATDVTNNFKHEDQIKFIRVAENGRLPFEDDYFDLVVFMEIIEHLKNPYGTMREIARVLRRGAKLVLSTPNILNLKSRCRFLTEGAYEYFREPPLDHVDHNVRTGIDVSQVHVMPWRYHDLEFLLKESGFDIAGIKTTVYESRGLSFLASLIRFQMKAKARRSRRKGGIDYERINKVLLSKKLLFGRHLIIIAQKDG